MAVTVKSALLCDVTKCGFYKNRRFGGTYRIHHQGDKLGELGTTLAETRNHSTLRRNNMYSIVLLSSVLWLLVTANVVPSLPILLTLMV
jgi:hypothetical protein